MKFPELGKVKTRLAKDLGNQKALEFYQFSLRQVLDNVAEGDWGIRLYFTPSNKQKELKDWLGRDWELKPQMGEDLGERMENAFEQMFAEGFEQVVIVGTDLPDLEQSDLINAFDALQKGDIVIGPAHDGGYYLLGIPKNKYTSSIFKNIPWSTPKVLELTLNHLDRTGISFKTLPLKRDIDDLEDYQEYLKKN